MPRKVPFSIAFDLPFDEAIEAARARKAVLPDAYYHQLPAEARRLAFTVSGLTALDQVQGVLDRMGKHLENGGTFADFKRWAASQPWELPKHRLETIFRNAVQTAYGAGHWRRFEETKDDRPYLMYDAVNDSRTRPAHRALDGIIRPVDDPFWLTHSPPMGHNCRCTLIQLDAEQAEIRSRNGRGLNQPETPEMRADDDGWGRRPMQRDETLRNIIRERQSACLPGPLGFGRKKRDPHANIDCSPTGAALLGMLDALPDQNLPMPRPQQGTLPLLPAGQSDRFYLGEFMKQFGAEWNEKVFSSDIEDAPLPLLRREISASLFMNHNPVRDGAKSKANKRGRGPYALYFAETITRPDEVWLVESPGKDSALRFLSRFRINGGDVGVFAVFKYQSGAWVGWTDYQTLREKYLEEKRAGILLYRRKL